MVGTQIDEARFAGKRNIIEVGYSMVINPLHRKTVTLKSRMVETMDKE
jgi:hypothetical protein